MQHGENIECHKTYERQFPEFFDDLQKYSYNVADRQWEFKDGPLHQNDKFTIKKFIVSRTFTGEYFPKTCKITKHGSSNAKDELNVTEEFYLVRFTRPHDAWFRIPEVCLNNPQNRLDELDFHDGIMEESKKGITEESIKNPQDSKLDELNFHDGTMKEMIIMDEDDL